MKIKVLIELDVNEKELERDEIPLDEFKDELKDNLEATIADQYGIESSTITFS